VLSFNVKFSNSTLDRLRGDHPSSTPGSARFSTADPKNYTTSEGATHVASERSFMTSV
jgi:hypothetical protein